MATVNKIDDISLVLDDATYYTGYEDLDHALNGLKAGTIVTVGGRPAMGKSTFMDNIILRLLEKYNLPILYVNMEETKEKVLLKFASIMANESYNDIQKDENLKTKCIKNLKDKKFNLYISDDCFKIDELERLLEENESIKFLVIDYIQLMSSNNEFQSKTDSYNDVLNRIRVLANKYGLVIFLLSQLSRSVERRLDNRPLIYDLSSSGNLEYISDVILFLYRDGYYNSDNNSDITEVIVAKNRMGPCCVTYLDYTKNGTKLIDHK